MIWSRNHLGINEEGEPSSGLARHSQPCPGCEKAAGTAQKRKALQRVENQGKKNLQQPRQQSFQVYLAKGVSPGSHIPSLRYPKIPQEQGDERLSAQLFGVSTGTTGREIHRQSHFWEKTP